MKISKVKTEVWVCSKDPKNIYIKIDDDALKQVTKFKYLGSIFTEDGINKEDTIERVEQAKVMFNNKNNEIICQTDYSFPDV
jgi:hypothetical protein